MTFDATTAMTAMTATTAMTAASVAACRPCSATPRRRHADTRRAPSVALAALATLMVLPICHLPAQGSALSRGMELEMAGRNRDAAVVYRTALDSEDPTSALLGLERAYAALGWTDSLLPVLDTLIERSPDDALMRAIQLRALLMVGDEARAQQRFKVWATRDPADPQAYREYSRLLLDNGRFMAADSVLRQGRAALGAERELAPELAQLRARTGLWELSARSWREALVDAPYLWQATVFSLQPAPEEARPALRNALVAGSPDRVTRYAASRLELAWGDALAGWHLLSTLVPDDSTVRDWLSFADEAEAAGASTVVADALAAVARAQPRVDYRKRAAEAALAVGRVEAALELTAGIDDELEVDVGSAATAALESRQALLAFRVRALSASGQPGEAERLAEGAAAADPALGAILQRELAWAWVRTGELERARSALARAGVDPTDEIHGWLEFYEGDMKGAREHLREVAGAPGNAVTVLALLGRTRVDSAPAVGAAFLALARGDSLAAVDALGRAAADVPDAAPMLLVLAGRVAASAGDTERAIAAWRTASADYPDSPEAAESELAWARLLLARGDSMTAAERLEQMIIRHPASALVPQARRELDAIPASARKSSAPASPEGGAGQDSPFTGGRS